MGKTPGRRAGEAEGAKDHVGHSQAHFHERFFLNIHKTFVIFG